MEAVAWQFQRLYGIACYHVAPAYIEQIVAEVPLWHHLVDEHPHFTTSFEDMITPEFTHHVLTSMRNCHACPVGVAPTCPRYLRAESLLADLHRHMPRLIALNDLIDTLLQEDARGDHTHELNLRGLLEHVPTNVPLVFKMIYK